MQRKHTLRIITSIQISNAMAILPMILTLLKDTKLKAKFVPCIQILKSAVILDC